MIKANDFFFMLAMETIYHLRNFFLLHGPVSIINGNSFMILSFHLFVHIEIF
jgi:hypothetical protein